MQHCGWSSRSRYLNNIDLEMSAVDLNSLSQTQSKPSSMSSFFDATMPCSQFVESNEDESNFSRTAAVMVFTGKILDAIECLKRASDMTGSDKPNSSEERDRISLNVSALALSAYVTSASQIEKIEKDNKDSLWIEMCTSLKTKLKDPYIKAIFTFLSMNHSEDENCFDEIIVTNSTKTFVRFSL